MKTKIPEDLSSMTAGQMADALYKLREERKEIEGKAEHIKTEEIRIKNHLIESMPKADLTRITGKLANISLTRNTVPQVQDWDKLYEYIKKNDAFDLMQKRATASAFKERWDSRVQVPGVVPFVVLDISVTKKGK